MIASKGFMENKCAVCGVADGHFVCSQAPVAVHYNSLQKRHDELLAAAKTLYEWRNTHLTRAGVAGYRQTDSGEWVCDPASQAFKELGEAISKTEAEV